MKPEDKDIVGFLDNLIKEKPELTNFEKEWAPLVPFLIEYEHLKARNGLTQKSIAEACGTTQSAISRLERMRGRPSYQLLRRLSEAVGGSLFLSPTAEFSLSIPLELHELARDIAEKRGLATKDFLLAILKEGISKAD